MNFEDGIVPKDWGNAVIVPFYEGKRDRAEWKNQMGNNFLSMGGYAGILAGSLWW